MSSSSTIVDAQNFKKTAAIDKSKTSPGAGISAIYSPTSALVETGIYFQPNYNSTYYDLVSFTFENSGNSNFNCGNFDIYIMPGIGPTSPYIQDSAVGLVLMDSGSNVLTSQLQPVADNNTSFSLATFEELQITGAKAGDILEFEASPAAGYQNYLSGLLLNPCPFPRPPPTP